MKIFSSTKSIHRITLAWVGLPLSYIIGWSLGYFLYPDSILGSSWGEMLGFSIGGGIGGFILAREIQTRLGRPRLISACCVALAWAVLFLLFWYAWTELLTLIFDPPFQP